MKTPPIDTTIDLKTALTVVGRFFFIAVVLILAYKVITDRVNGVADAPPEVPYTKLEPAVMDGKTDMPSQIWLDPGTKLTDALWREGKLKWTTRPVKAGEVPQNYTVLINGSPVLFIEQAAR